MIRAANGMDSAGGGFRGAQRVLSIYWLQAWSGDQGGAQSPEVRSRLGCTSLSDPAAGRGGQCSVPGGWAERRRLRAPQQGRVPAELTRCGWP